MFNTLLQDHSHVNNHSTHMLKTSGTSLLASIVIKGRGTEITVYDLEEEVAEYWADQGEQRLSDHVHKNGLSSTDEPELDLVESRFVIPNLSTMTVLRHARGFRFEHGFKVLCIESGFNRILDVTDHVTEANGKVLQMGTRSADGCTVLGFRNDQLRPAMLTTETTESGHIEFICPLYGKFDPSRIKLMVAHQGEWPIVYGIMYDDMVLDVYDDNLRPNGNPSAHVCLFI